MWLRISDLSSDVFSSDLNLEEAQERKVAASLDRLDLGEGDRLLEIGCGCGGLAQSALERKSISYDGLTLSPRQKTLAEEKLAAAGLSDRSHILLTDYRDAVGQYDAIASVEMVEAVGQAYWPDYLAAIHRRSEEHTSELQSLMSLSYAVFCWK